MKRTKSLKTSILLATAIFFVSCLKKEAPPKPIVDYGGITNYFIVNKTGMNLKVTYKISPTPIDKDSTVTLTTDTITQIFKYGGLGGHFPPSYVFDNLLFYNKSDNNKDKPLLTIDPVNDDNWNNVTKKGDNETNYQLIISSDDLK
jgi:hypothetical protein